MLYSDHDQGGVSLYSIQYTPYTGLAHNNQLHPRPQRELLLRALLHHARLGHRACHQRSEPGGGWSGAIRFQVTRPVTAQIIDNASKYLYFSESYFESEETLKYKLGKLRELPFSDDSPVGLMDGHGHDSSGAGQRGSLNQ